MSANGRWDLIRRLKVKISFLTRKRAQYHVSKHSDRLQTLELGWKSKVVSVCRQQERVPIQCHKLEDIGNQINDDATETFCYVEVKGKIRETEWIDKNEKGTEERGTCARSNLTGMRSS